MDSLVVLRALVNNSTAVQRWLAEAVARGEVEHVGEPSGQLIAAGDLRGNLVTDAHLAALAIEHGVGVCSFDSDFARFDDLTWTRPADATR